MTGIPYRLARGMRLRREPSGEAYLMIPEGIVALNETAAAALELADGTRDLDTIVAALRERFDDEERTLSTDVREIFDAFAERGFLA